MCAICSCRGVKLGLVTVVEGETENDKDRRSADDVPSAAVSLLHNLRTMAWFERWVRDHRPDSPFGTFVTSLDTNDYLPFEEIARLKKDPIQLVV